jgi:hypothetical protein
MLLVALLLLLPSPADARKKPKPPPEPLAIVPPEPAPPAPLIGLFTDPLPISVGELLPAGLANLSAQGCNACHYDVHDGWRESAHATAHSGIAFREAVAEAGTPACQACHLPLQRQHSSTSVYLEGDVDAPLSMSNAGFDATLSTEGVTCAACHIREGKIVSSRPGVEAPHTMAWSAELTSSEFCAPCHQLTWPGADKPFYDTYGEWQRSPQAAAGVQCQDCHLRSAADDGASGSGHSFDAQTGRGVSLLVDVQPALTRGGATQTVNLTLQNTGSGHAYPTGSPYQGIRLVSALVAQDGGKTFETSRFSADLTRTISDVPPWTTLEDSRLPPGATVRWSQEIGLELSDPAGPWTLRVVLVPLSADGDEGSPVLEQLVPLVVD